MNPDPLAALRDIHLPAPVSWWPLAPGWWWLAGGLGMLIWMSAWAWRRHTDNRLRRAALTELDMLTRRFADDQTAFVQAVSTLLRRCAVSRFSASNVAGLIGEPWLEFLDRHGGNQEFMRGPGRILLTGPYAPQPMVDTNVLAGIARRWITRVLHPAQVRSANGNDSPLLLAGEGNKSRANPPT
jgi:hypothetical protein